MSSQLELARMAIASLGKKDRVQLLNEVLPATDAHIENRLIRRAEVAHLLACTGRTVDNYANDGLINRVKMPGRKRAFGYRYADVVKLINGSN